MAKIQGPSLITAKFKKVKAIISYSDLWFCYWWSQLTWMVLPEWEHVKGGKKILFTITIPNDKHINNSKRYTFPIQGQSKSKSGFSILGAWVPREVFDNEMLNANPNHMLSSREGLDLRTNRLSQQRMCWLKTSHSPKLFRQLICLGIFYLLMHGQM